MRNPADDEIPDDVREALEAFLKLPLEERLFPTDGGKVASAALGVTSVPGTVDVTLALVNPENGERLDVSCQPIRAIRRDVGHWSLMVSVRINGPAKYAGVFGELVFARVEDHPPESVAFFRMSNCVWRVDWEDDEIEGCHHVWESLEDGSLICFECDERRPAEGADDE